MKHIIACSCLVLALVSGGSAFWMQLKSTLGQVLLNNAWQTALSTGDIKRAWPWADTWPVARLDVPAAKQSLVVLEGVSGEAMAFGPGRVPLSSSSAKSGTFIVGGHRDSHLQFLEHIKTGDVMELETSDGAKTRYKVTDSFVANAEEGPLSLPKELHALVLITCYPFNALQTGGPLRYVVVALPDNA